MEELISSMSDPDSAADVSLLLPCFMNRKGKENYPNRE